jgi:undecaprenyl-diphosphatase
MEDIRPRMDGDASARVGERLPLEHAIALGAIQGPTELLPVSSSGHLTLVPAMLGWRYRELDPEIRKSFEVALHAGGALALLIGLRKEVAEYLRSFGFRNLVTLSVSFAPAAVTALRFERSIERRLGEPAPVAIALLAGSVAMTIADGRPEERSRDETGLGDALVIGMAQALALAPGVSRNGATLTAARWRRFRRADANVISRQVALPVIVGASILKGARLATRTLPEGVGAGMAAGAVSAFGSTLVSMRLIAMLERSRSLRPYALYRAGVASAALVALARRRRRNASLHGRDPAAGPQSATESDGGPPERVTDQITVG